MCVAIVMQMSLIDLMKKWSFPGQTHQSKGISGDDQIICAIVQQHLYAEATLCDLI